MYPPVSRFGEACVICWLGECHDPVVAGDWIGVPPSYFTGPPVDIAPDGMPEYEGVEPEGTDIAPPFASISAAAGFLNK